MAARCSLHLIPIFIMGISFVSATVRQRDVENNVTLSVSASDFLKARHLRFNYYAVKALEARFYLWLGGSENKAKACACAKEVMDAVDEEGKPVFELGSVGGQDEVIGMICIKDPEAESIMVVSEQGYGLPSRL